jgi:hypothetical protein
VGALQGADPCARFKSRKKILLEKRPVFAPLRVLCVLCGSVAGKACIMIGDFLPGSPARTSAAGLAQVRQCKVYFAVIARSEGI